MMDSQQVVCEFPSPVLFLLAKISNIPKMLTLEKQVFMIKKLSKFLEGFGSVLNLFPTKNTRQIILPKLIDRQSLQQDWEKIGMDMWNACGGLESKYKMQHKDVHEQYEGRTK